MIAARPALDRLAGRRVAVAGANREAAYVDDGGFAMAAAPAIVRVVGGGAEDALDATRAMYDIAWSESRSYQIPALGFRGTPLGIDAREVVATRVLPFVNTGIAHREPGVGQIGAGLVKPPMEAFVGAVRGLAGQ